MTTPTENPAAVLRAAAKGLRDLDAAATAGPWCTHDTDSGAGGYAATVFSDDVRPIAWLPTFKSCGIAKLTDRNVWNNAAFMAAMRPVAAPLADWLESAAVDAEQIGPDPRAMRVARAILSTEGSRTDA